MFNISSTSTFPVILPIARHANLISSAASSISLFRLKISKFSKHSSNAFRYLILVIKQFEDEEKLFLIVSIIVSVSPSIP